MENLYENILKKNKVEPIKQLHAGGFELTKKMVDEIFREKKEPVILDICCGNGFTVDYINKKYNIPVYGIDISNVAIKEAKKKNNECIFEIGSLVATPFKDNQFDYIIGQEPDAFVELSRNLMFEEMNRILKRKGVLSFTHYWIPSCDWNFQELDEYYNLIGNTNNRVSSLDYIKSLLKNNFSILSIDKDYYKISEKYIRDQVRENKNNHLVIMEKFLDRGLKFGIKIEAKKLL